MTFEIVLGGQTRAVTLEPEARRAGRYRVTLDGRRIVVDARRLDPARISLLLVDSTHGSHEVTVLEDGNGDVVVGVREGTLRATVDGRRRRRRRNEDTAALHGEQRISAPMPGRVVRVAVKPGDVVAARQGLVVVEAMKMENELTSPKAGRVKEVAVVEGMSVEAGRLLVVVD